jgi:hypothetical protein
VATVLSGRRVEVMGLSGSRGHAGQSAFVPVAIVRSTVVAAAVSDLILAIGDRR